MIIDTKGPVDDILIRDRVGTDITSGDVDQIFKGNVRLRVTTASVKMAISFVNDLRARLPIRIIELRGTPKDGLNIRIALRGPLPLISTLGQMEQVLTVGATQVEEENGYEPLVHVQLAE